MKLRTSLKPVTTFNAISLTDIVFLLLIFFLLSSTFILQPGVKVELPTTTTTEVSAEKSIVLTIDRNGTLFLNEEFTVSLMVGLPMVSLGIFFVNWRRRTLG